MNTGVYCIRNRRNGKRYVGSAARSIKKRWESHVNDLNGNRHGNDRLQRAWNKYGPEAFVFKVLQRCPAKFCIRIEQRWMDRYRAAGIYLYNICPRAGSCLGSKRSMAFRRHMRRMSSGKKQSAETIAKRIAKLKGHEVSAETRAKIAARHRGKPKHSLRGRPLSLEHRAKIGAANKGRKHEPVSAETRAKISKAGRGKKKPAHWFEWLRRRKITWGAKISAAQKGRIITEEHRAKLRAVNLGKKHSEETRKKISIATRRGQRRKRWERFKKLSIKS